MVWMQPSWNDETDWYEYGLAEEATNEMAEYIGDLIHPLTTEG